MGRIGQAFGVFLIVIGLGGLFLPLLLRLDQPASFPSGVAMLFAGFFITFGLRLSARRSFKRDFASQPKTKVVISDTGISFSSPKGNSNLNWSGFVRYVETKHLFVLPAVECLQYSSEAGFCARRHLGFPQYVGATPG
jgi:hypothetical protein